MTRLIIVVAGLAAFAVHGRLLAAPANTDVGSVRMSLNPSHVCATSGAGSYPNVDLIIENQGGTERKIEEVRAVVRDGAGHLLERRLLWQQALSLLGSDVTLPPKSKTVIFNPFAFSTNVVGKSLTFEFLLASQATPIAATTTPRECVNAYRLSLPISGRVLVYDGFDFLSHHRRGTYSDDWSSAMGITDNFQRFGLDLVVVDDAGRYFTGDGMRTDQWLGWGKPVRAAAGGIVAATHDGQPDNVVIGTVDRWTTRPSRADPMSSYGNYVLIDHGRGEYSLVGHLRNRSVRVVQGERVSAGQAIGAMGNSGASGGVHTHFERRTGWGLAGIQTLPAYFSGVTRAGSATSNRPVAINSGDVVVSR